jgi:pimeloyl-ACP methyl ester carboxylesterase
MLSRIADRLIMCPSTDAIDTEDRKRQSIQTANGTIEAWTIQSPSEKCSETEVDVVAIKFPGAGGRAERGGPHPFEVWPDLCAETWTINHHGYGGSDGQASMQNLASTCRAVWAHVRQEFPSTPIVVVGNSLGCISALYLAANESPAGVFLRNPVPIHQLISTRLKYNWWNLWQAKHIAKQVPLELDSVANASKATCPLMMVRSELDRVIPEKYQRMIFESYAGEKTEFVIEGADHHNRVPESQTEDYVDAIRQMKSKWLGAK